jgi:4-hydroxybenzoate polyprenyltransferase
MDESPMNPASELGTQLATRKEGMSPTTSGYRQIFTLVTCISAAGESVVPGVILEGNSVPGRCLPPPDMVPELFITASVGHCMTEVLFIKWLELFANRVKPTKRRPVLLLVDNHRAHVTPTVIKRAIELHVELVSLPPNTTSVTQPLDVAVFGPLKVAWRMELAR